MAVYDGVPSIRLEGDQDRALALIPEAKALLYSVQTFKNRAGVNTFSMSQRINDDSTLYVLCAGEQNIIQISVAPKVPERVYETKEEFPDAVLFPDFYSGMVYKGYIEDRVRDNPNGSQTRYKVCELFSPTRSALRIHKELKYGRQAVTRLAVRPWTAYDELNNQGSSGNEFSQYTKLRSSMYSGKMKKVVQIVMGLGRIGKAKLRSPNEKKPDSKYMKDVAANGVEIRFDWRFIRTHGITVADDGRLWLIEISLARGVIATPLPIFPGSRTLGFREKSVTRADDAMTTALTDLGCIPTGEAFPAGDGVAKGIADGTILRLLEPSALSSFYQCSAYSSSMGWAFNEQGTEAHNTGYYFGDDGFQRGVWYQVNIHIGALKADPEKNEPIASATANLVKQNEGYIYCPPAPPGSYARYVPIKFHEPMLPGLMSHEGVPTEEARGLPVPKVDTPMFVCFVDDELELVKYYRNPKQERYETVDDPRYPGECMLAGDWTITTTSGNRSFPNMMYSNKFDDRRTTQETTTIKTIKSQDLGYDPPKFTDFIEAPEGNYVWRERIFKNTTVTDIRGGEYLFSAVAIPQYSREAYYYASGSQYNLNRFGLTQINFHVVKDPNVGYGWRCLVRLASIPFPPNRPDCNTRVCRGTAPCSSGGSGFHKERRVVCLAYEPNAGGDWVNDGGPGANCHEFADAGPWLEICQIVDNFNSPGMNKTPSSVAFHNGPELKGQLFLVTSGYNGPLSIPVTGSAVLNHWMTPSPDPVTDIVQFITAEHSAIGEDMMVYSKGLSSYLNETGTYGQAPDTISQADGFPTFIGVNES